MADTDKYGARQTGPSLARGTERKTGRLEAFSDGIFAIAITLLIVDVRIPPSEKKNHLLDALMGLWPSYFALVVSFVVIGIYWCNHYYVFKLYQRTDHIFNLLHLLFLLTIAILPFPTRVLADYIESEPDRVIAVGTYILGLLLPAVAWFATWMYARWSRRIVDPRLQGKFLKRLTIQYGGSMALYLLAFLLTMMANVWMGLTLAIGLTLLYLLPPPQPLYDEANEEERERSLRNGGALPGSE